MADRSPSFSGRWRSVAAPLTVGRAVGQGLELVGWLVIAGRMGPSLYGLLVVAFLLVRYLGLVVDWGGNLTGARDTAINADPEHVAHLIRHRRWVGLAGSAVFILGAIATGHGELAPVGLGVLAVGLQVDWLALGRGDVFGAVSPWMVRGTSLFVGSLFVSSLLQSSWLVGLSLLSGALVSVIRTRPTTRGAGPWRWPPVWPLVGVLAAQVYISSDALMLAWLNGDTAAGIYGAIYRVPLAWTTIVGLAVTALIPLAALSVQESPEARRTAIERSFRFGLIGGGLALVSIPVTYALFDLIFTDAYASGRGPLMVLLLAVAVLTVSAPLGALVIAHGRDRLYAAILVGGAIGNFVVNLLTIPEWGLMAAAVSTLLTELAVLAAMLFVVHRITREATVADP